MSELKFKGYIFNGIMELDTTKMVCVPSKPKYADVDICLKDGMNVVIARIYNDDLSFEEKKKLGYEIATRWNNQPRIEQLEQQLEVMLKYAEMYKNRLHGNLLIDMCFEIDKTKQLLKESK